MFEYTKRTIVQLILLIFLPASLSGCISAPSKVNLGMLSNDEICWRMNYLRTHGAGTIGPLLMQQPEGTSYWEEIVSRGFFSQDELDLIASRSIQMGMREEALICSWGRPSDVNSSVGSWGEHKQYVYGGGSYVYVENGRVTSWQN